MRCNEGGGCWIDRWEGRASGFGLYYMRIYIHIYIHLLGIAYVFVDDLMCVCVDLVFLSQHLSFFCPSILSLDIYGFGVLAGAVARSLPAAAPPATLLVFPTTKPMAWIRRAPSSRAQTLKRLP
ncbi:hypothetical protein BDV95DRAFT_280351 [Massariosphaeria phaeospora]|uniref:Uncharacterized protein n=1 Tax=Massariosphaeria phaeospora TaxID=100035 RepID=A0A7C8IF86_9PLEO|nr:hypothetical protein BDV95DRAFT_280351 [Massariosphaeria phaeospora]